MSQKAVCIPLTLLFTSDDIMKQIMGWLMEKEDEKKRAPSVSLVRTELSVHFTIWFAQV